MTTRKQCPDCKTEVAAKSRSCPTCGYSFYEKIKSKVDHGDRGMEKRPEEKQSYSRPPSKQNSQATEKYLKKIDQKLSLLLINDVPKKTWVKSSVIKDITGWDRNGMRRARSNKILETRKSGKILEYCLESLPVMFIKNTVISGK